MNIEITNDNFKKDIESWLVNFVEVQNPKLNNWAPCPFAKEAREKEKITYTFVSQEHYFEFLKKEVLSFDSKENVHVIGTYPNSLEINDIKSFKDEMRQTLVERDVWVLFDHPHVTETVRNISFNNGKYVLAIIQSLSKLNDAAQKLMKMGYYEMMDKNYLELLKSSRPNFPK